MVIKCVSFFDEDQINFIPETCNKPTVIKGRRLNYSRKVNKTFVDELHFRWLKVGLFNNLIINFRLNII